MLFTADRREHIAIPLASHNKLERLAIVHINPQSKSHRIRSRIDARGFSRLPVACFHGLERCNSSAKYFRLLLEPSISFVPDVQKRTVRGSRHHTSFLTSGAV
jgi:hypothetical protein